MTNSIEMKTKAILLIAPLFLAININGFALQPPGDKVKVIKKNVSKKIADANESGHNAILVVTDKDENNLDAAVILATETASQSYETMVAMVYRDSKDNDELVEKYHLHRYTLPYLLIISANGSAMGGVVPGKVTPEQLAAFVPTACANKVIGSRTDGKASYLFVPSGDEKNNQSWLEVIKESLSSDKVNAELISVNPKDESEALFLTKIGYSENIPLPMLVVLNKQSKITARYTSLPDAGTLSIAANKVVSSGCGKSCPSSKSCVGKKTGCGTK